MIALTQIRIDGGTQSRAELNQDVVAEYAEAYKAGAQMPPVVVFFDGTFYWLGDGFHRYFGAKAAGMETIYEERIPGTQEDAFVYCLGANHKHGLRRTNADKRHSVEMALGHAAWESLSDNEVAKRCGVSQNFVSEIHRSLKSDLSEKSAERTYTTKHGTTATMKTANIGAKPAQPAKAAIVKSESAESEPDYDPDEYAQAEMCETIKSLSDEVDALKDRIAAGAIAGTDEEKTAAIDTMCELRKEITRLEIENKALVASRDSYQVENAELKTQCTHQRNQIARMQKASA